MSEGDFWTSKVLRRILMGIGVCNIAGAVIIDIHIDIDSIIPPVISSVLFIAGFTLYIFAHSIFPSEEKITPKEEN